MNDDLLIGCDPELFVAKKKTGEFVSAYGLVNGTKDKPYNVECGTLQVDGMALEIGIRPAATSGPFIRNINTVMKQLQKFIPKDLKPVISPVAYFSKEVMDTTPAKAKELGCTPDFNAWTGGMNPPPQAPENMRSAGGHIHLGWTNDQDPFDPNHFYSCCTLVKNLDYFLGLPSLILDPDTERRQIYGKAGAFRAKPYGLEYRSLSNFWITNPKLMRWAFDNTQEGFKTLAKDGRRMEDEYGDVVVDIINNNKVDDAKLLCKEIGIRVP
jgi:hypothetical protein